jgi:hypothetical protein
MCVNLPESADDITPALLTALISRMHPGVTIDKVEIIQVSGYGEQNVSTSARVRLNVIYGNDQEPRLPTQLLVKMSLDPSVAYCAQLHAIYANEVDFYTRLRPELDIEAPEGLGGYFDSQTKRYALVLGDLSTKSVRFPSVMQDVSVDEAKMVLETHARLHARYWESPRFKTDLSWVQTHTRGDVEELMNGLISDSIVVEIDKEKYKREIVGRMRTTEAELRAGVAALKRHQSTLPQTLLHGDSHIGNTYLTKDTGGLLDWQIMVRGYPMHDVAYFIATALPIELRRAAERELLAFYREKLRQHGVPDPPSMDSLWLEYCRAGAWGVYIGWLTCPVANYGWEINVMSLLRVATAFEDHDSRKLMLDLR